MEMVIKVSVIIPVYNVESYLDECLDSVCKQTLTNIEILCINDGSTDNSLHILQKFAEQDNRIIIINQENQGASHARNVGIQHAKGEYIYFLDSDDYLAHEALETLVNTMDTRDLEILLFNANVISEEGVEEKWLRKEEKIYTRIHKYPSECKGEDLFRQMIDNKEYITSVPIQLVTREFLEDNSLMFYEGIIHEDELFVFKCLLLAIRAGYIDNTFYFRRVRHNSVMDFQQSEKILLSVFSGFICLKQMLQFYYTAEIKKENEGAVFSNFERMVTSCCNRYGVLNETAKMKILEMTGKDKLLFREWILASYKGNESIKQLRTEVKQNTEKIRKLEAKRDSLQKELTKIKASKGFKLLRTCYHARDVIQNGIYDLLPERKSRILSDRYFQLTGETIDVSNHSKKTNKVLIVEFNWYHGECIPGFFKYLKDLNYEVDLLINERLYQENVLDVINCKNVYHCDVELMGLLLQYIFIERYGIVIFNSNAFTWEEKENWKWFTVLQEFPFFRNYLDKIYVLEHQMEHIDKTLLEMGHVFVLTDKLPLDKRVIPVNCHWFGNGSLPMKNKVVRFITVGAINPKRRNLKVLLDAVETLYDNGITDFHITVIGLGKLDNINPKIRQFFSMLGRVSYSDMYAEMRKSDFYLSLLDPENPEHDRYITSGTSGSFQLIYGFSKPCLIAEKFADIYGFTSDNAVVYKGNKELVVAMLKAIDMTDVGYERMRSNLITMSNDIYKQSLSNLKRAFRKSDLTGKKASSTDSNKKYFGKEIALKQGIPDSKRVTTRDNRVTLINYWTNDPAIYNKDWLYRFIKSNTNIEHLKVFSLFGEKEYVEKYAIKRDVFYSGENLDIKRGLSSDAYSDYCLDYVGLSLGFAQRSEPNYLRLPLWMVWIFDPAIDKDRIAERVRFINQARNTGKFECSIIARHDKWNTRTPIYEALKDKMDILCAGKWNNNTNILWDEYSDNKIKLLNDCKFTICAENTDTPYYVTEKLFEAFLGGCVPIYAGGASRPEPGIVNPDAVLLWEQGNRENNDAVVRKACELNQNEKLYTEFISQTKLLPYTVDYVYDTFLALQKRLIALGESPEI